MSWGIIMTFVFFLGFVVIGLMVLSSDERTDTTRKYPLSDPEGEESKVKEEPKYDQAA